MEVFITAHVDYDYDELFNELEEICRLENEPMDDFFQRVMQFIVDFLKVTNPQTKKFLIGLHILSLFLKGTIWVIKISLIHKIHICIMKFSHLPSQRNIFKHTNHASLPSNI
jgi:hypothetical protein